jgi:hypothetical protein
MAHPGEPASEDSARTATPPATRAIPAISAGSGSWCRTITPTTVALAGSNDMSSAKAARGSLAIASWSVTYGITDEQMPTPQPAPSRSGR